MERPSFDDLVTLYRKPLTSAAYHLCADRDAAHDIVQETLIAAYQGLSSLRDPQHAKAWLFGILRRKAASHHRSRRAEAPLPEDRAASPPDADALVHTVIREQLERLSAEDREVLAGHYLFGLSYQELAEALGIREGAVRVRCFRAKERMRVLLEGAGLSEGRVR